MRLPQSSFECDAADFIQDSIGNNRAAPVSPAFPVGHPSGVTNKQHATENRMIAVAMGNAVMEN
jgi:hypothetical protein